MSIILDGTSGITTPTTNSTAEHVTSVTSMKNRIINGGMVIDQRNAGASVTPADGSYTLDRWKVNLAQASKLTTQQDAGAVTPPAGFRDYLGVTSTSAYSVGAGEQFSLLQNIEGFNFYDMAWGTANAQAVTLSFWVRSSLTGTFGGALNNSAYSRSYPFTFTISVANTWEQKLITIAGDTSGTWIGATNGVGLRITFNLGTGSTFSGTAGAWSGSAFVSATGATSVVGTSGATFYITGVQLEKGSTATSFDYRPYGTELALCQRYYYRLLPGATASFSLAYAQSAVVTKGIVNLPVTMRIDPSALEQSGTATNYAVQFGGVITVCSAVPTFGGGGNNFLQNVTFTVASGLTTGQSGDIRTATGVATGYLGWSAEL